jgi:ABC-type transporter Mla subunit MlaD
MPDEPTANEIVLMNTMSSLAQALQGLGDRVTALEETSQELLQCIRGLKETDEKVFAAMQAQQNSVKVMVNGFAEQQTKLTDVILRMQRGSVS